MSGYILCKTPMASVPYYIKNVGTNIYSIEELCYYLYQNLYLVDESLMNVGLCKWIGRELRMKAQYGPVGGFCLRDPAFHQLPVPGGDACVSEPDLCAGETVGPRAGKIKRRLPDGEP